MARVFALALTLVVLAGLPAEAASTWTKLLTIPGEVQAMAPAPSSGVYVATSPIDSGASGVLYRYESDGSVAWKKTLGTGGFFITGLASDSAGNAYVAYRVTTPEAGKGYPYRLQRVTKTGTLGWLKTWYDDDMSLTGGLVAVAGSTVYVAQRDTATGDSAVRRFKTSTGASSKTWTLSGSKKPAGRPTDLVAYSGSLYLLDVSGALFRLRSDGTVQWKKQLPGKPDGDLGCCDVRVRRYSLTGSQKWDKAGPSAGSSAFAVAVSGSDTIAVGAKWVNDNVKSQIVVTRMDASGKVKGSVKAGTKEIDSPGVAIVSGGYVYVGGYAWAGPNRPVVLRVKKP
jgi:hypothetical protein